MDYLKLIILWIIWCIFHSLLISLKVTNFLGKVLGDKFRFYRLFYNIFSLITFLLLVIYVQEPRGEFLFSWSGYLAYLRPVLLAFSAYLFIAGAKNYDKAQFLGLSQILKQLTGKGISASGKLNISGILAWTRHPWYLATLMLIWSYSPDLYMSGLIINIILSAYVIIGMLLEEKKLEAEFGEVYRNYQKSVPILIPYKKK